MAVLTARKFYIHKECLSTFCRSVNRFDMLFNRSSKYHSNKIIGNCISMLTSLETAI